MEKMFRVVEVVLVQWNLVDNQYQQNLRYYILLRPINLSHAYLLNVEPSNLVF